MLSDKALQVLRNLDCEANAVYGYAPWSDELLQFHILREVPENVVEAAAEGDAVSTLVLRGLFGLPAFV